MLYLTVYHALIPLYFYTCNGHAHLMIEHYFHQCKKMQSILHQIQSQGLCSQHHHRWDLQHTTQSRTLSQTGHISVVF